MNEVDILSQIYNAITTAPAIFTPPFIERLLAEVLPLAESGADNDTVEDAINKLYREFTKVRDDIKGLKRKNLDDAEPEITPGYETVKNEYPDIEKLEANLKKRIQEASNISAADAKN
ncbi:hypothetical protein QUB60_04465 [Microcoleus sp. A2-C5]|uniref:hypothetical protein n=1 Tax=Microcoleaceae TaxID=1892252 RepID=UPI0022389D7C|nr:hypothetical protein [Lyngbya sp. CCAP 1446/10]MCW6049587.1 hypothetical protein [Lyngbya sp. CCAP 1446/10]